MVGSKPPLVRQHSMPLTENVKAKLLEARRLLTASEDVNKREQALEKEDVDASSVGVHLKGLKKGSSYIYSVTKVLHAELQKYVRVGDVLLMVRQIHITNRLPSEVELLCQTHPDPKGSRMVFSTLPALEEENIHEVEFVNLRVCFEKIMCVEVQVLECRKRQVRERLLRVWSPTLRVPKVRGKYLQVDSNMRLRLDTGLNDEVDSLDNRLKVKVQLGHCDLDNAGSSPVHLLSLALQEEDGSILYFAAESCLDGSLPLKFQALGGPPFVTEGDRTEIRPGARCAVFQFCLINNLYELRPIDFDVTICVENDMLIGKTNDVGPSDIALFDFLSADLSIPGGLPTQPDSASTSSESSDSSSAGGSVSGSSPSSPDSDIIHPPQPHYQCPHPLAPRDDTTQPIDGGVTLQESRDNVTPLTDSDVTPPRENGVSPLTPENDNDGTAITKDNEVTSPKKDSDVVTSKEDSDVILLKEDSDVTPPKEDSGVTPSKASDATPSKESDVPPSKDSDATPSKEGNDITPSKDSDAPLPKDSDVTSPKVDSDVIPPNEEGKATTSPRKEDDVTPKSGDSDTSPLVPKPLSRQSSSRSKSDSSSDSSDSDSESETTMCMPCFTSVLKPRKWKKLRFRPCMSRRRSVRESS